MGMETGRERSKRDGCGDREKKRVRAKGRKGERQKVVKTVQKPFSYPPEEHSHATVHNFPKLSCPS